MVNAVDDFHHGGGSSANVHSEPWTAAHARRRWTNASYASSDLAGTGRVQNAASGAGLSARSMLFHEEETATWIM